MKAERFETLIDIANGLSNYELAFLLNGMKDRLSLCVMRDCPIDGDRYQSIEAIADIVPNGIGLMIVAKDEAA
jgi:hypothetical protein